MNRPSRQRNHLLTKIAEKETRTPGKAGKRLKRWIKWSKNYEAVAGGAAPAAES